jgi:DNA repair exonuclease SbcCD ATPase subunit
MRDVLRELEIKQIIIVSHETKIESFVENVIRFKKEHGVSKMIEERLI